MSDWFQKLSPQSKKAYIKAHPTSKYAKAYKAAQRRRQSTASKNGPIIKPTPKTVPPENNKIKQKARLRNALKNVQTTLTEMKNSLHRK